MKLRYKVDTLHVLPDHSPYTVCVVHTSACNRSHVNYCLAIFGMCNGSFLGGVNGVDYYLAIFCMCNGSYHKSYWCRLLLPYS